MSFQVGDQVRLVKFVAFDINQIEVGDVGIVTNISSGNRNSWPIEVQFKTAKTGFKEEELELTELSTSPLWEALK